MTIASPHVDAEPRTGDLPRAVKRLAALGDEVDRAALEPRIALLVKLYASQINGCAYCVDLHVDEALAAGLDAKRLHLLPTWRKLEIFDERERAALAFTEAVTLVADGAVPREVWDAAANVFSEEELGALLWHTIIINAWNRHAIALRTVPESLAADG
jgi:AhpD family alkylhydroperoxidase